MRVVCLLAVASMMVSLTASPPRKRIFLAGDSTMSIKSVTAYPETGWGMPFVHFWNESITIFNLARNGRSTKTFSSEGLWQQIMDSACAGDYVFIQFGHNDEVKTKVNSYTTPDEFSTNLMHFVDEVRAKGATPVLMTPVARRKFDDNLVIESTHEAYSILVRKVATEKKVVLMDMDRMTMDLYQKLGVDQSKMLFLHLLPGEHPNYPEGKEDNTHFNELGARMVAQMVLQQIRIQLPDLAPFIVSKK